MQTYSHVLQYATSAPPRERGFWLSAFLLMSMLENMVMTIFLIFGAGLIGGVHPDAMIDPGGAHAATIAHHAMWFLAIVAIFNLVMLTGAWMWKKWGVYGYGLVSLVGMLVGMRLMPSSALLSLLWGGVVGVVVFSKWRHFE